MFNGGEFSKILDEIFEKDEKEKEKAIKIYCKIWKYLENITLQNLKYERAFEILGDHLFIPFGLFNERTGKISYYFGTQFSKHELTKEEYELLEELMKSA